MIIIIVKPASGSEHPSDYSRLTLEHWELVQAKDAQDATAEPINTTSIAYNVETDDCTIVPYCNFTVCTFKKLLDRDPVGEEPKDIVIPPEALHTLARAVFRNNQYISLSWVTD